MSQGNNNKGKFLSIEGSNTDVDKLINEMHIGHYVKIITSNTIVVEDAEEKKLGRIVNKIVNIVRIYYTPRPPKDK